MISYRKLRIILMDRKLKISPICKAVGLSYHVGNRIMNDQNIELISLLKICKYLGIKLDDAVELIEE